MRQAVETRYLKKNNNSQKFRSILIDYFQKSNLPDDHRLYEEVTTTNADLILFIQFRKCIECECGLLSQWIL
jgi:hypothetical protein